MRVLDRFGPFPYRYEGHGVLTHGKRRRRVSFDVGQRTDGQIVVAYQSPKSMDVVVDIATWNMANLSGYTTDGGRLSVKGLQMIEQTAGTNMIPHGLAFARSATTESPPTRLNRAILFDFTLVNLILDGWRHKRRSLTLLGPKFQYVLSRSDRYAELERELATSAGIAVTAMCRIQRRDGRVLTVREASDAASELCTALSWATGTKVNWIVCATGDVVRLHESRVTKGYSGWFPSLRWSLSPQRALTAWLGCEERTYYRPMIEYFADAVTEGPYIQTRILTAASVLDSLTGRYAKAQGMDVWIDRPKWRKVRPQLVQVVRATLADKGISAPIEDGIDALRRRPFRHQLTRLLKDHSLPTDRVEKIVAIRNRIVHEGATPSGTTVVDSYRLILWCAFVTISRLVGYRGTLPPSP